MEGAATRFGGSGAGAPSPRGVVAAPMAVRRGRKERGFGDAAAPGAGEPPRLTAPAEGIALPEAADGLQT